MIGVLPVRTTLAEVRSSPRADETPVLASWRDELSLVVPLRVVLRDTPQVNIFHGSSLLGSMMALRKSRSSRSWSLLTGL